MTNQRAVKLSIDLAALRHNFQQVKKYKPHSKIMPVIKANAYGHGSLRVAQALTDADGFAVAQISEAIYLRENGINKPLTVFQGFSTNAQLKQCLHYQLRPAITQLWQIDLLDALASESEKMTETLDVWLKINTGMGRLGVQIEQAEGAWARLQKISFIQQSGAMMHFANADEIEHESNQQQLLRFQQLTALFKTQTSVSNSAAIIGQLTTQEDWVRPGIMLYGASPTSATSASKLNLKAVMTLQAELIAINQLKKNQTVGYGNDWLCPEDMPVGIVNIGYGDGYPRHAPAGTAIMVNGQKCSLIGRVSMDSIAVDLRNITAQCGDEVELWGKQLLVDEVASSAGSIAYELLCNVG